MNLSFANSTKNPATLTYDVLIEPQKDGGFSAIVIGLPECKAEGTTKEEVLTKLRQLLQARLEKAEIVSLEIEPPKKEHPWMKLAGMFEDDPQFDEMLKYIEEYRQELDAEMEAYYQQMDAEDKAE